MEKPNFKEKRMFIRSAFGYSVRVHGEIFFDYGFRYYISPYQMPDGKIKVNFEKGL